MLPIFAKAPCCLELFECCCRRLSQLLIPLRHCLRDASFCVCLGSGSFCHEWASHCSVLFWSLGALFVFLGSPPLPPGAENSNPSWFKNPFYVNPRTYTQMQFLQPTHSEVYANAVPTHKLSGSEQLNPFWTLSQRCGSKKHEPKQNKQARWTKPRDCLRLLLCSFLGFEPKATIQLDCNNCLNVQDLKIFLKKTLFN